MINIEIIDTFYAKLYNFFNTLYMDQSTRSHMDTSFIDRMIVPVNRFEVYEQDYARKTNIEFGYQIPIYNSTHTYPDRSDKELGYILICPDDSIDYKECALKHPQLDSLDFKSKVFNDIFTTDSPEVNVFKSVVIKNHPDVIMMELEPGDINYYKKFIYDIFTSALRILDTSNYMYGEIQILANILTDTFITQMLIGQDISYSLSKYTTDSKSFNDIIAIFRANRKPTRQEFIKFISDTYNENSSR